MRRKKTHKIKIVILFCAILFSTHIVISAQIGKIIPPETEASSSIPNIIPPSPTAYALGNYGNMPVGLFTGSPNISVSLFTYKTNHLTLPLSLFYGSNGIRVDEVSSNVGLGWNLNFGGVITRMVRGLPDELHNSDFVPNNVMPVVTNTVALNFFQTAGNSKAYDTQRDIYSFNFNGISGKFFYDRNLQPHLINQEGIKIEGNPSNGLILILPNGEKYYFFSQERTNYRTYGINTNIQSAITGWYLTKIVHPKGDEIYFTYEQNQIPYYIGSRSQTLKMTYPYLQEVQGILWGQTPLLNMIENSINIQGLRIKTISSNKATYGTINFEYFNDYNIPDIEGNHKIQNITWKDQNEHILEKINFNYLNTSSKRNFLSSLTFSDPNRNFTFDYENPADFPERLNYSQDYWGYYNGKLNINLVPQNLPNDDYGLSNYNYDGADRTPDPTFSKVGMLKKITYPTKGYTELEYEGNTYWGEKKVYPPIALINVLVDNPITGIKTEVYTFTSIIDQKIKITGDYVYHNQNGTDPPPGGPTHDPSGYVDLITDDFFAKFYIWDNNTGQSDIPEKTSTDFTYGNTNTNYFDAKAGKTYTLSFNAKRETRAIHTLSYYAAPPTISHENVDTGGVRVKSTKEYGVSSVAPKYTRYYYGQKDNLNHSSGNKGFSPMYIDSVIEHVPINNNSPGSLTATFLVLTSSSIMPMYDNNSSCFYEYVTISNGGDNFENGGEEKQFIIHRDYPGEVVWGTVFQNAPWANYGWDNGLELKSQTLKKDAGSQTIIVLSEKENTYEQKESNKFEMNNYAFRLRYELPYTQSVTKICTQADIDRVFDHWICITEHHHEWSFIGGLGKCIMSGANNINQPEYDLCRTHQVGETVYYWHQLNNLDVMQYKNISYWHFLKSQKTTDYVGGVPLSTVTEYFYNNPLHYQPTSQKTTFPNSSVLENHYQYAHEKGNQYLQEKNMIGIPLETETTKTANGATKTISKTETVYPTNDIEANLKSTGLPLPYSILQKDLKDGTMIPKFEYKYDISGNIIQYTLNPDENGDGTSVAIIWGYKRTQPIAKIEGATMPNQILAKITDIPQNLIDPIVSASDDDADYGTEASENALLAALDDFRTDAQLSGFQITTYTYDPLIGVRSITPPSGIREYYNYDAANRLKEVKDINGNMLKEYQYHYKP